MRFQISLFLLFFPFPSTPRVSFSLSLPSPHLHLRTHSLLDCGWWLKVLYEYKRMSIVKPSRIAGAMSCYMWAHISDRVWCIAHMS